MSFNERGAVEYVTERISEHEKRVMAQMARAEARAARAAEVEDCGAWCQVKRRAGRIRFAPHFS